MARRKLAPMRANQRDMMLCIMYSLVFMACSFRKSDGHDKENKNRGKPLAHGMALQKKPWALSAPTARNHPKGVLPDPRRTAIKRTADNSGKHFLAHAPDLLEKIKALY